MTNRAWVSVRIAIMAVVSASCSDSPAAPVFGTPARVLALDGVTQSGIAGQSSPVVPSVLVIDTDNKPVPGVTVAFTIDAGSGSVTVPAPVTDSKGIATAGSWILGETFGSKVLTATVGGLAPVIFTARAIAPDAGISAFSISDPAGDTITSGAAGFPRARDVVAARGEFRRDSLILTLTFAGPVGPVSAGGPTATGGYLEIDIDNDPSTGTRSTSNSFGASANLGVDYEVDLFTATATTVSIEAFPSGATAAVSASFSGNSLVIRIPFTALGNDDGRFGFVGLVGTVDRPTDYFPNSGAVAARPGGG